MYAGTEYEALFRYLFTRDAVYRNVIDAMVGKKYGLSYEDIARETTDSNKPSGSLLEILGNLERSELIERRGMFLNLRKGARLFVTDEYIRFVSRWLTGPEPITYTEFNQIFSSQSYATWQGFDFELIAFKNVHLIAQTLGISGIAVKPFIYYQNGTVQIDLLLERGDRTITICEAKSYDAEYEPTEDDVSKYRARKQAIQDFLKARRKREHFVNYCFIVRNGIKRNRHFNAINPLVADLSRVL